MKRNLILLSMLIFIAFTSDLLACSRFEYGVPTCAYYTRADAVFLGKAIKVKRFSNESEDEDNPGGREVQFQVLRNFKGAGNSTITIETSDWRAACGLRINKGQRWIIYANYDEEDKIFRSSEGDKYNFIENKEEMDFLKTVAEGKAEISIFGRLVPYLDLIASYDHEPAEVTLAGSRDKKIIKTNSDGTFKFSSLPADNYKIQLKFPFRAALDWYPLNMKYSLAEGIPTILDYEIELKQSECNYTQFGVFKYTLKQTQQ